MLTEVLNVLTLAQNVISFHKDAQRTNRLICQMCLKKQCRMVADMNTYEGHDS